MPAKSPAHGLLATEMTSVWSASWYKRRSFPLYSDLFPFEVSSRRYETWLWSVAETRSPKNWNWAAAPAK